MRGLMQNSLRGLLIIGMGVQCAFGVVWIVYNFAQMQDLQRTADYIQAGRTLVTDEYMGILYSFLVAGAMWLEKIVHIPFYCMLYLLQMGIGFVAGCFFLYRCHLGGSRFLCPINMAGSLYLMTVPMAVQCHLSVLPQSLILSGFLTMLGLCFAGFEGKRELNGTFFLILNLLWAGMTLLQPDYFWLAGLPAACMLILCIVRKKSWIKALFWGLAAVAVVNGIGFMTVRQGSYGRIQRTMGAAMVSRMVWPNFSTTYFFWPEEIKEVMSEEMAQQISVRADSVQTVFGPIVESAFGKKAADRYYWQMAISCLQVRTKENVETMWQDFAAYFCVPWSLKTQLGSGGRSFSGWNYGQMRENAPVLTGYYVHYSLWMFRIGMLIAVCVTAAGLKGRWRKRISGWMLLTVLCLVWQAVWYTMSGAGMMDYLNVPVTAVLWYTCLTAACRQIKCLWEKEEKHAEGYAEVHEMQSGDVEKSE